MSFVIKNSKHKGGALLTLIMIANYAGADGAGAWPSIEVLARDTRLTTRAVQVHLRELMKSGELIAKYKGGPGGTNLYTIAGVDYEKISPRKDFTVNPTSPLPRKDFVETTNPTSPNPSLTILKPSVDDVHAHPRKPTSFPTGFVVTISMREWADREGVCPLVDLVAATSEFVEYWTEGEGDGQRRKNWELVWKTRMRFLRDKALEGNKRSKANGHDKGQRPDSRFESYRRAAEAIAAEDERLAQTDSAGLLGPGPFGPG